MFEITTSLMLLLPFLPLFLLFTAKTDVLRRAWLLNIALTLLIVLMASWSMNWLLRDARLNLLGDRTGAAFFGFFFENMWVAVAYALIIAVVGYFANKRVLHKIGNKRD